MEMECVTQGWMIDDSDRLSEVPWGFLDGCLKGAAGGSFELAGDLGGFNAWRVVIQSIRESRNIRFA